jgi:hypothetical protein
LFDAGDRRGGIIFSALFLLVLAAAGAWLWSSRERLSFELPVLRDSSELAAWTQDQTRGVLARRGVREEQVLRSHTVERRRLGARWLEATWELSAPPEPDAEEFRRDIRPLLAARGVSVLSDRSAGRRRELELGRKGMVFQRVIFRRDGKAGFVPAEAGR